MACYCSQPDCPFVQEGIEMSCKICPYSDGEEDE